MRTVPATDVFTRPELHDLGWSDPAISRAVRSGRLLRVRRGLFAAIGSGSDRVDIVAAAAACSGSVASHRSAAIVHGLPILGSASARPDLTVQPGETGDTVHALVHRATLRPEDVTTVDGIPVTSVARTLVDLARSSAQAVAVVALDAALHRGMVSGEELLDVASMCRTWPGARRISGVLSSADGRAESPLETVSRLIMRHLQLPAPDLQCSIMNERGRVIGRTDFYWDRPGVVGEADGELKYAEPDALVREKRRQEALENAGLIVVRWGWPDLNRPSALADRIQRAFRRGAQRDATFPRHWSVRAS